MEFNKHARAAVVAVFGLVGSFQVIAFSGGITNYERSPTDSNNIDRTNTRAATTSERDVTYQRTMRKSQAAAAAARAAKGIIRNVAGIGSFITLAELAIELGGIWELDFAGNNVLKVVPAGVCTVAPCNQYRVNDSSVPLVWSSSAVKACQVFGGQWQTKTGESMVYQYMDSATTCRYARGYGGAMFMPVTTQQVTPVVNPARESMSDLELEDRVKGFAGLPDLLEELETKGSPIPFSGEEIEDMPQPLILSPRVTVHPDGSKTIEQVRLRPFRGPDGKTINWERELEVTQQSAPDANGNSTSTTTKTTSQDGAGKDVLDIRSECEKSPDTLGCIGMDKPELDIPKTQKNVTYSAETMFGSRACPADVSVPQTGTGRAVVLSYTPTCNALATYVKPIIIAVALFMAYLIILPGSRE